MKSLIKSSSTTNLLHFGLIAIVWFLVQVIIFYKYDINLEGESIKYFREANEWITNQQFTANKYWFYSSYIFIHVFFKQLGIETWGTFLFQSVLSLLSVLCFYKALRSLLISSILPLFLALYLASLFPLQQFNSYLYTESIFISLSTIWTSSLIYSSKRQSLWFAPILIAILMVFTRPTGIYFLLLSICWILILLIQQKKTRTAVLLLIGTVGLGVVMINFMMNTGGELDFWLPFEQKHIICGVPTGSLAVVTSDDQSLLIFLKVFQQYPSEMLSLMFQRLISFWKIAKPHYSLSHNLILVAWMYPLFIIAFSAFRYIRKNILIQIIVLAVVLISFSVMVTCNDWMNRFILPLIPLLLLAAGISLQKKDTV